jgi:hypothetical protein
MKEFDLLASLLIMIYRQSWKGRLHARTLPVNPTSTVSRGDAALVISDAVSAKGARRDPDMPQCLRGVEEININLLPMI